MTRKHFRLIADVIKENVKDKYTKTVLIHNLCWIFKQINPRFDANRFNEACSK